MTLPLPKLDDKLFSQIAEEARALIPSKSPEWTDHNVHDPGITFLELFAWLAEIEHYRLDRTSAASFVRFLALAGLTPRPRQAAEVEIAFEFEKLNAGVLVPANTKVSATGRDAIPFETLRDLYLTRAKLQKASTHAGGRVFRQFDAADNRAGDEESFFDAFGPSPEADDYLRLGFDHPFQERQGHLGITLFEKGLPPRQPFAPGAAGFVPSARVRWEYLADRGWVELSIIEDTTLHLSRSGEVIFHRPDPPQVKDPEKMKDDEKELYWLRAVLVEGRYEIPPRLAAIATNTVRARQVEKIVNEDLGQGWGTPDQEVRLKKAPLLLDSQVSDGPFQVGEVLDWTALVLRLARPKKLHEAEQARMVKYIARRLREDAGAIIENKPPTDDDKYLLAQAFNILLDLPNLYQRKIFPDISIPEEFSELKAGHSRASQDRCLVRRFNRFLLERVFPDLMLSHRLEIQTGRPVAAVEDEPKSWRAWERVEDFSKSGPDDRHYSLDPETGKITFGNGLNGRVPLQTEFIRARFYYHSEGAAGNLPKGAQWQLATRLPAETQTTRRQNRAPAEGGVDAETLRDARDRSREVFRKEFAVLTASDYEAHALGTPGLRVARAKVVANFNHRFPTLRQLKLPGEVTVIVVPQPGPDSSIADPPVPSDGFLKTVSNHLETRRMVTTNIHVVGPHYEKVTVKGKVFLKKGASVSETEKLIKKALTEFLDPIHGGPDRPAGWPFGRSIFPSEIYQQLAGIRGVDYVASIALNEEKPGEPFKMPYNGLPKPGDNKLEIIPFERRRETRETTDLCKGEGCRD